MDIGIDLGGTNIAIGLVDDQGHIIYKDSVPTNASRHYSEIIRDMFYLSEKVVQDAGYQLKDINTVGVGSPGIPDKEKGMILYANNLNFYNVPLKEEIQKMMNLPIFIDNDANCAAYAEAMVGAAKDVASSVTITLGTGIGSGVIIDNQIYSGFKGAGGELGHIVIQIGGEQCTCGRKGCWERYGSATALILQTKKAAKENPQSVIHELVNGNLDKINGKTAFDAERAGDKTGKEVVENYIRYLAEGIVNVINAFQPEVIVIGGGISKEGSNLIDRLNGLVQTQVYCKDVPQTKIRVAQLGNDAGIIGAAMLYRQTDI